MQVQVLLCAPLHHSTIFRRVVRARGLEPPTLSGPDPKSGASAIPPRAHSIKSTTLECLRTQFFHCTPQISIVQSLRDKQPNPRKREEHLSRDGKWRSFPTVPHLLQYVISENYFGKVKINGQSIRHSLRTTVWITAPLHLNDFLKEHRKGRNKVAAPKFWDVPDQSRRSNKSAAQMPPAKRILFLNRISF